MKPIPSAVDQKAKIFRIQSAVFRVRISMALLTILPNPTPFPDHFPILQLQLPTFLQIPIFSHLPTLNLSAPTNIQANKFQRKINLDFLSKINTHHQLHPTRTSSYLKFCPPPSQYPPTKLVKLKTSFINPKLKLLCIILNLKYPQQWLLVPKLKVLCTIRNLKPLPKLQIMTHMEDPLTFQQKHNTAQVKWQEVRKEYLDWMYQTSSPIPSRSRRWPSPTNQMWPISKLEPGSSGIHWVPI